MGRKNIKDRSKYSVNYKYVVLIIPNNTGSIKSEKIGVIIHFLSSPPKNQFVEI
jgi:hypothetical protein